MRYRKLGETGLEVSILGFGAMRLPLSAGRGGVDSFDPNVPIDESEATKMVQFAIEHGINYFDTAYGYHGGKSEIFLGKALRGNRSKVMIATKLPIWLAEKPKSLEGLLDEQLERLNTSYIDFYLLHGLNRPFWSKVKDMDGLHFLDRLRDRGRIRFAGFSFHDDIKTFKDIIDAYDWSMCLVQYNFYDEDTQAGKEGIAYAASRGVGVVVMEPLRGGKLAEKIPHEVQALWDSGGEKRSPAEWAMRWVWNHADVSCVLTGSSSLAQLTENVRVADGAAAGSLSPDDLLLIQKVKSAYRTMLRVDCTGCAYCMPCPNGVNIPTNFSLYNDRFLFKDPEINTMIYNHILTPEQRASNCTDCGECEELCPQNIRIADTLKDVHEKLVKK